MRKLLYLLPVMIFFTYTINQAVACGEGSAMKDGKKMMMSASTQPVEPINNVCPITGEPVDKNVTSKYKGRTLAFCNVESRDSFKKMSAAEREEAVRKIEKTVAAIGEQKPRK